MSERIADIRIFLVSLLTLFLELMLIRWLGTEVRIFAYLQNTVLVVCFLGLGMGCWTSDRDADLRLGILPLLATTILMAIPSTRAALAQITFNLTALADFSIFYQHVGSNSLDIMVRLPSGLITTFGLLLLVWASFVPLGRLLGSLLDQHPNLVKAYSINLLASLAGIWLFASLSLFYLPPFVWFLVLAFVYAALSLNLRKDSLVNCTLLLALIFAAWFAGAEPGAKELFWSPYQKLALKPEKPLAPPEDRTSVEPEQDYTIEVNNVGYQTIRNLTPEAQRRYSATNPQLRAGMSQYDLPYLLSPNAKNVLIVGAGSGNDAAGALRHNVERVTAVEIDPVILRLGKKYHPEKPYDSPKVQLVTDDARSFFAKTLADPAGPRYDLIVMGLLDSHTTNSLTNAPLDSFVYTKESLQQVKGLLAPGGMLVLSFGFELSYVSDRMARIIKDTFGDEPISFRVGTGVGGRLYVAGNLEAARREIENNAALKSYVSELQAQFPISFDYQVNPSTDDWPYLYLKSPRIPLLHLCLALLLLLLAGLCQRLLKLPASFSRWSSSNWHFFFLGAGFMLLEMHNIIRAAVVLGNTWWINAIVISGILIMALLANLAALRARELRTDLIYPALLLCVAGLYCLNYQSLYPMSYVNKSLIIGLACACPIFFSGLIFIGSFKRAPDKGLAMGANLLGALIGGILQSFSFVMGISGLLLLVAAFYCGAWVTGREKWVPAAEARS